MKQSNILSLPVRIYLDIYENYACMFITTLACKKGEKKMAELKSADALETQSWQVKDNMWKIF